MVSRPVAEPQTPNPWSPTSRPCSHNLQSPRVPSHSPEPTATEISSPPPQRHKQPPLTSPCPGNNRAGGGQAAWGTGVGDKLRRALTFPELKAGCSGSPGWFFVSHPGHTYRAIMIPATPVCMARLASSYDKMSPFPEGQRLGPQGAACRRGCQGFGSSRQPSGIPHRGRRGPR